MLEKFIELVELQSQVHALECEIEDENSNISICSLDSVQLQLSSQKLFDEFCEHFELEPTIEFVPLNDKMTKEQRVIYKNVRVFVFEGNYREESK